MILVNHDFFARVFFVVVFLGEKNKVCKVLQMAWTFVNDR